MTTLILIVHVIVSLALILIVLLQTGKGAEMGASFGGSNQTVFGSGGSATFLSKVTTAAAILFMLTSLSLAYLASKKTSSIMRDKPSAVEIPIPAGSEPVEAVPAAPEAPPVPEAAIPTEPVPDAPALPEPPAQE
jgi:preprotein translocase subunit SecG